MIPTNTDKLFEKNFAKVKSFAFDQQVTEVFEDMISRSVPGYDLILKSIAMFCMRYAQEDSLIYDLGSSLGAVSITAAKATSDLKNCQIEAIDTSVPMIEKSRAILERENLQHRVTVHNKDVTEAQIQNASVVVSNFTLQFLPKEQRAGVVNNIHSGLNKGGIFILSEKFKSEEKSDPFLIDHYHAYKKLNGYSNKEIQAKRQALKDVLIPDSTEEILERLQQAGFQQVHKWFQCFNFASFIAIKD